MTETIHFQLLPATSAGRVGRKQTNLIATAGFFETEAWTARGLVTYFTLFVIDVAQFTDVCKCVILNGRGRPRRRIRSQKDTQMQTRRLGTTGIEVSEIGFGAWQLGNENDWAVMSDTEAHRLVADAVDQGVTLFDTAPHYAATNSERLLGEALEAVRSDVVLVSKFGHTETGGKDFRIKSFWSSLEGSLRRLRTDYLDVLLLHNPPLEALSGRDPVWAALEEARMQGRVRHYGVSLDLAREIDACLRNTGSTVLEVLFNIFHQDARRGFPLVAEKGAGVIIKVPLDSGWLTGRFDASHTFTNIRSRWTRDQIEKRAQLVADIGWLTQTGESLTHQALAYALSYGAVSCVIPGMRTVEQLRHNVAASGKRLRDADRLRLERFWDEVTDEGRNLLPW